MVLKRRRPPRRRPASLALRATALHGIATTLAFLAFNWIILRSLERHFEQKDAQILEAVAAALSMPLRQASGGFDDATLRDQLANVATGHHLIAYGVFDDAGGTVYATPPGPDLSQLATNPKPVARPSTDDLVVWRDSGRPYRGMTFLPHDDSSAKNPPYRIVVAKDIQFQLEFLRAFKRMLWLATGVVLCIALAMAWLAVQWGFLPIRRVNEEIRAIRSSELDVRLNPNSVPIELAELVVAFNDTLARIESGFTRLSNFSADIAHELRTPVTNLITQTQVALGQSRPADEYREILYSNLEEFDRMSRMIGDMQFLAQTENDPCNLRLAEIDLGELVRALFDYFEALAEDRNITLCSKGHAGPIRADREMIFRALSNLLSNAIRHTPRGAPVTVILAQDDEYTTISVENIGNQIPEADLPKLFDRFFRGDPAHQHKSAGAGLGLAIVKSIAEVHGGKVCVTSNSVVTRFDLVLPHLLQDAIASPG